MTAEPGPLLEGTTDAADRPDLQHRPTLERSLAAGGGQTDAFDLFFLAMAHHRLGHREQARAAHDRAVRWLGEQKSLTEQYAKELAAFCVEAEAVLAGPAGELLDDVFAPPRSGTGRK